VSYIVSTSKRCRHPISVLVEILLLSAALAAAIIGAESSRAASERFFGPVEIG